MRDLCHQDTSSPDGSEEESAVDLDMKPRLGADLEGMDAVRLRHPGLAGNTRGG